MALRRTTLAKPSGTPLMIAVPQSGPISAPGASGNLVAQRNNGR
jgi:hypothetical protein